MRASYHLNWLFYCAPRRRRLSLEKCLDDFRDATALNLRKRVCYRCPIGRTVRQTVADDAEFTDLVVAPPDGRPTVPAVRTKPTKPVRPAAHPSTTPSARDLPLRVASHRVWSRRDLEDTANMKWTEEEQRDLVDVYRQVLAKAPNPTLATVVPLIAEQMSARGHLPRSLSNYQKQLAELRRNDSSIPRLGGPAPPAAGTVEPAPVDEAVPPVPDVPPEAAPSPGGLDPALLAETPEPVHAAHDIAELVDEEQLARTEAAVQEALSDETQVVVAHEGASVPLRCNLADRVWVQVTALGQQQLRTAANLAFGSHVSLDVAYPIGPGNYICFQLWDLMRCFGALLVALPGTPPDYVEGTPILHNTIRFDQPEGWSEWLRRREAMMRLEKIAQERRKIEERLRALEAEEAELCKGTEKEVPAC